MRLVDVNKHSWFSERCLEWTPKHFVQTQTPVTPENLLWVWEKTKGRYSLCQVKNTDMEDFFVDFREYIAFEDSKEAVYFELTWS